MCHGDVNNSPKSVSNPDFELFSLVLECLPDYLHLLSKLNSSGTVQSCIIYVWPGPEGHRMILDGFLIFFALLNILCFDFIVVISHYCIRFVILLLFIS